MDFQDPIVLRGIERIFVVVGGIIFGYFGYRLFIFGVDKGDAKISAKSYFYKIVFSGTGPGLFFMAFGAIILVTALFTGGAKKYSEDPSASSKKTEVSEELQINKDDSKNVIIDEQ